jgi:hypothetical protein
MKKIVLSSFREGNDKDRVDRLLFLWPAFMELCSLFSDCLAGYRQASSPTSVEHGLVFMLAIKQPHESPLAGPALGPDWLRYLAGRDRTHCLQRRPELPSLLHRV